MSAWARDSLRLRLLAGTLAWVLLSVLLAGWGLRALLREHITQQLQQQLVVQLDALSGSIDSLVVISWVSAAPPFAPGVVLVQVMTL